MTPLQVIILIMVVLYYVTDGQDRTAPATPPWLIVSTVVASHLFIVAIISQTARRISRRLHHPDVDTTALAARMDSAMNIARWATVALAALQLWGVGWGGLVLAKDGWGLWDYKRFLLPQALFLFPAVASWMCFWASYYNVEIALRQRAMPYRLAVGLPTHEAPSRWQFIVLQARHSFYFFIPMAIASLVETWSEFLSPRDSWVIPAGSLLVFVFLLAALPWIITRFWPTVPMTGTLRERLEALAGRYHLRFTDILVWRTHHSISNAAILGYMPFARYFLMTDALLESLTDRQIEAVFAHEVGHGCHKHIWWYAFAIGGALLSLIGVSALAGSAIEHHFRSLADNQADVQSLILLAGLAAFMVWGFAPISRLFEHQADWFAARHMSTTVAAEPADDAGVSTQPSLTPLQLGAEDFSQALMQLVGLSNRPRNKRGWMHPSPTQRVELLRSLAAEPSRAEIFARRVFRMRLYIVLLFAIGLALMGASALIPSPSPALPAASSPASTPATP